MHEASSEQGGAASSGALAPTIERSPARGGSRLWRGVEFTVFFVLLPILPILWRKQMIGLVIPMIWAGALLCLFLLRRDPSFDRRQLWNSRDFLRRLGRTLLLLLPLGALISLYAWKYLPGLFLTFPLGNPLFWVLVMICYPVFSAYPQELIFRTFILHRYEDLFKTRWALVLASALVFGWAHAFLGTWIAVLLPVLGGVLFARTYLRTGSLLQCSIEHGLWGDLLFTVGIGWYFYAGSIGA